jgi:hypothetical protein
MNQNIKYLSLISGLVTILLTLACKTEMVTPIDPLTLNTGAYMRIISGTSCVSTGTINRRNLAGTKLSLVHEAVTPNSGTNFDSYVLEIRHVGTTTTAWTPLRTVAAADYRPDAQTNYPRHTFEVTGTQAMTATTLDTFRVLTGSRFELRGTMKLKDGRAFNADNTSSNITGGAFYCSPFTYRINVLN